MLLPKIPKALIQSQKKQLALQRQLVDASKKHRLVRQPEQQKAANEGSRHSSAGAEAKSLNEGPILV